MDSFIAHDAVAITPSDTVALAQAPVRIFVGGAGNVIGRAINSGADVTFACPAGAILPVRFQYIRATGTTATGLIGLY